MGEIKDKVMRKIVLMPTFIELDKAKYKAGTAIVDPVTGIVLRNVSDNFKLVTNDMLVEQLNSFERIRNKEYYINDLEDTTYIRGIFPERYKVNDYEEVIFLGYEIQNSYSLRFPPQILIDFYIDTKNLFIKTDLSLGKLDRRNPEEEEMELQAGLVGNSDLLLADLLSRKVTHEEESNILTNLKRAAPFRLRDKVWHVYLDSPYKKETLYNLLMVVNIICEDWSKTSYEQASKYARKLFHLTNSQTIGELKW